MLEPLVSLHLKSKRISSSIKLGSRISNLSCRLRLLLIPILRAPHPSSITFLHTTNNPLRRINCGLWSSPKRLEHLPGLIHYEDSAFGLSGRGHANGGNESVFGVAEQGIGEGLLGLEGGVRFGAVGAEAVD